MVGVVGRLDVLVQPEDVSPTDPDVVEGVHQTGVLTVPSPHPTHFQEGRVHVHQLLNIRHQVSHRSNAILKQTCMNENRMKWTHKKACFISFKPPRPGFFCAHPKKTKGTKAQEIGNSRKEKLKLKKKIPMFQHFCDKKKKNIVRKSASFTSSVMKFCFRKKNHQLPQKI